MSSKRNNSRRTSARAAARTTPRTSTRAVAARHTAFIPLLVLSFVFWLIYRGVFNFSVLFDELIGKAIFFGLPVWLYVVMSGFRDIGQTFSAAKIKRGLLLGLAVGGLFGFATSLLAVLLRGNVMPSWVFASEEFVWQFMLGLMTSFWETLFFFSFVMLVVRQVFRQWSFMRQVLFTTLVFVLFHAPNAFLRFQGVDIVAQLFLLTLFALGQALFFWREKNGYALVISQTLWGMVLLLQF